MSDFEMDVVDVFRIKGRGPCVTGTVTKGEPMLGMKVRIGTQRYVVAGIETHGGRKMVGDNIGILLGVDTDELELPTALVSR